MKYWKRFVGDLRAKTAGLSLAEFGAYDKLMDEYYATEEPLPAEAVELFRIVGAFADTEQRAVLKVRDKFFRLGKDGRLHHDGIDARIDHERKYASQQSRAADIRWENERMRRMSKTGHSASSSASESVGANPISTNKLDAPASAEGHANDIVPQPQPQNRKETHRSDTVGPQRELSTAMKSRTPAQEPPAFTAFYDSYPRREARKKALEAWMRLDLVEDTDTAMATIASIMAAIAWQRKGGCLQMIIREGQLTTPLAATWLRGERWKDERPNGNGASHKPARDPAEDESWRLRTACTNAWGEVSTCARIGTKLVVSDPLAAPAVEAMGGIEKLRGLKTYDMNQAGKLFAEQYYRLARAAPAQPVAEPPAVAP